MFWVGLPTTNILFAESNMNVCKNLLWNIDGLFFSKIKVESIYMSIVR